MIFSLKHLKHFLFNIDNNNITQINIQSDHLHMIITKNQKAISRQYTINEGILAPKQVIKSQYEKLHKISQEEKKTINNLIIKTNESESYSTIVSPMVGTFYRSPAPNEPAFIEINEKVQKRQTVCIIEAMKLMNEIEAEVDGEIVEILVKDGEIVDCGQALMKVKNFN
uniref:Biotin carboxyl carrier protein of acetyl-CoA carboxylase n=1 Tax=Bornetia secundiflora TaxID=2575637 RepID=A0A4D6WNI9_9FLOR|nr:acetyl-CoA carboxylase, biotin carboxyl carrier protein [Bornetia secundiflora]